jgi:hypothetical protein
MSVTLCKICEETMSENNYKNHMEEHNKLVCWYPSTRNDGLLRCNDYFDTTQDYLSHVLKNHNYLDCCGRELKNYRECDNSYGQSSKSNFFIHVKTFHSGEKFVTYKQNDKEISLYTTNQYIINCCQNKKPVKFIEPKKILDNQKLLEELIQTNKTIIKQNNILIFNATKCEKIEKSATNIIIEDKEECYICMEVLKEGEINILEPCKHKFCSLCTSDILKYEGNCPVCKKKYESIQ